MKKITRLALVSALWALSACVTIPRARPGRDPLSPSDHMMLGDSYLSNGDKESALEQYNAALAIDRRFIPPLVALGNIAYNENRLSKARSYYERAMKIDPQSAVVINNVAMVDVAQGKHLARAKAMLDQALPTAGPVTPYLLDTLANLAILQGRLADAKLALDQADAAAPKNDVTFHHHIQDTREKLNRLSGPVK